MVKEYKELSIHPEYPELPIVQEFVEFVLDNSGREGREVTISRLHELSDKQYHTYEKPDESLCNRIEEYLVTNWMENTDEALVKIMNIAAGFCLRKEIFHKALEKYDGVNRKEFQRIYDNSTGLYINPWWDLKKSSA